MNKIICILLALCFYSCDKLDKIPDGVLRIKGIDEMEKLLETSDLNLFLYSAISGPYKMSDNFVLTGSFLDLQAKNAYLWTDELDDPNAKNYWKLFYKRIYIYNLILNSIEDLGDGEQFKQIKAECLLFRGFHHFYLASFYAKIYDEATAGQDLGIPYVVESDASSKIPDRETLKDTYTKILADIQTAIDLGFNEEKAGNATMKSALSIMARVYYYMSNYDKALIYAQQALDKNNTLSSLDDEIRAPFFTNNEYYFNIHILLQNFQYNYRLSQSYINSYPNNPRITKEDDGGGGFGGFDSPGSPLGDAPQYTMTDLMKNLNIGTSVAEMRFIKAECLARSENSTGAKTLIESIIREKDGVADFQVPVALEDKDLYEYIYKMRRMVLLHSGLRWFDMRKMDKEDLFDQIDRTYEGQKYTLSPKDKKFTLLIPKREIEGTSWVQNER